MDTLRFLNWKMYKDAKRLNKDVGALCKQHPIDIKKKYSDQFNRASLSVCLNIAEAAGRYTDIEMCRYFDYALGSLSEVIACADNLKEEGHLSELSFSELQNIVIEISKQIQGMQNSVYKNPKIIKRA